MKKYNFKEALELASQGLEPIFTRDEEHIIDLISLINGLELTETFKKNVTFISLNFSVDESGNLCYTENGVIQIRKALEGDIAFTKEYNKFYSDYHEYQ